MSYFLFFIVCLFYGGLAILTATKPGLAGENAMGYGLALAFLGLGLAISSLTLTIIMLVRGNFMWVSADSASRTTIVAGSWLFMVLTAFFCAVFKWEWHNDNQTYPSFLHWLAVNQGQIWIPLFWLFACFLSLNGAWQASLSPNWLRISFWLGAGISLVYSGGLLLGYLRESGLRLEADRASQQEQTD